MKNILLLLTTLFASITMSAAVITVQSGANLQTAINGASSGDEVKVQAGTFTGNFTMKDGVQVSGGWDETFTTQTEYATILDAQGSGRVLNQAADFATMTIWENFTIQNGNDETTTGGGGVWLAEYGQVKHCLIQNNKTKGYGGGVGNNKTSASLHGNIMIDECIIRNNYSELQGGGCRIGRTVRNSIIEYNQSKKDGGGVYLQHGRMENCIVRLNKQLGGDAGGVRAYGNIDVVNNLIYGNVASNRCGGLSYGCKDATALIANNVIICNQQLSSANPARCGVCGGSDATPNVKIANNIVWGNKVGDEVGSAQTDLMTKTQITGANSLMNNAVYNATVGDGGINLGAENPGFKNITDPDTTKWDLSLLLNSSLIDAGYDAINYGKAFDGSDRIQGNHIDVGAYETALPANSVYVYVGEDLQAKIDAAAAGSTVYVQAGTFTGNFTMKNAVQVSGGWNETFTTQTEYGTILDAQSNGRVLNQAAAFTTLTVWSNFTIQNGKLTTALTDQGAAGVFLNKKGRVQDCLIQNNIVNTTITGTGNDNAMGGGVSCNSGNADPDTVAYNCVIKNNSATHGGGVRVNGKGVVVYNCVIEENQTTNNAAGGIQLHNGSKLINCIVHNNKANGDTGGVRLTGGNVSDIINCLIVGNEATNQVGGIAMDGNLANIINCTIVGNKQNKAGATASLSGVKVNKDKNPNGTFFVNNIVWGNITGDTIAPQGVYYISRYDKTQGQRSYNAIIGQKGDDDTKTCIQLTAENPGFVNPENGDFRLVLSQLVEGGDNTLATASKDLAGNNRIINDHVDYGCYEYTGAATLLNEKEESEFDEGETDVVMRRSFVADGSYYSLALPFAMSQEQVAATFGACEISELKSSIFKSETDTHMELRLDFAKVASIEANKPYLFLPQADVTNPVFEAVTLSKTTNDIETDYADMKAILTPTTFDDLSDGTYFLGSGNMLQPLNETSSTVKAYRGYFVLHQKGEPAKTINKVVRAMVNVNNAPTAITMVAKQAQIKKMLINNQIVIMRNDNVYTVLGSQIY